MAASEHPPTPCTIFALGDLRIERGSVVQRHFRTKRIGLILAYLAINPLQSYQRTVMGELLWPEIEQPLQLQRLRQELHLIKAMGPLLTTTKTTVTLASGVSSDVHEFERHYRTSTQQATPERRLPWLRTAFEFYQGDFLADLFLPGEIEAGKIERDWVSYHRQRLARIFEAVCDQLVRDLRYLGLHEEAASVRLTQERLQPKTHTTAPVPMPDEHETLQGRHEGFFGREKELAVLLQWADREGEPLGPLGMHRICTLTGTGGIGKTRLSKEVARCVRNAQTVFVDLSVLTEPALIPEAIHSALRLVRQVGVLPQDQVAAALRVRGPVILLLDNLEQLGPDAKAPLLELLESCPETRFLLTSRRPLGIEQEHAFPLHPLAHVAARGLFLRRACAIRRDFGYQSSPELIDEIVTVLEGIPLALELAAARAALLEPEEMRERVKQLLGFLSSLVPDRSKRHRSLRASLKWGYALLSPGARTALTRLALFRGGISLAAAEAVLSDQDSPLDLLEELYLNALLNSERDGDQTALRYSMLTVVQQFAEEQLPANDREEAQWRHASYFGQTATLIRDKLRLPESTLARQLLSLERDNFRRAVATAAEHTLEDNTDQRSWSDLLHAFMERLGAPLIELGYWSDVDRMLEVVGQHVATTPLKQAQYLGLCGALARRRGNEELARRCWERKLALIRADGEPDSIVNTIFDLCGQAIDEGDLPRARALVDEGSALAGQAHLLPRQVVAAVLYARIASLAGELGQAQRFADDAHQQLSEGEFNDSLHLYVLLYTLSIYRGIAPDRFIPNAVRAIHRAVNANQSFVIARVLDELSVFFASLSVEKQSEALAITLQLPTLFLSSQIHQGLASRLADQSAQQLTAYLNQHEGNELVFSLLARLRTQPQGDALTELVEHLTEENLCRLV